MVGYLQNTASPHSGHVRCRWTAFVCFHRTRSESKPFRRSYEKYFFVSWSFLRLWSANNVSRCSTEVLYSRFLIHPWPKTSARFVSRHSNEFCLLWTTDTISSHSLVPGDGTWGPKHAVFIDKANRSLLCLTAIQMPILIKEVQLSLYNPKKPLGLQEVRWDSHDFQTIGT